MGQTATSLGAAAVKEGQRCFDVPLDTTMQNVRMPPGSQTADPGKFYALSLGSGTDGLAPTCQHPKALPMSSMSVGSNAPTIPPGALTQGYPRHGDTPMGTGPMLQSRQAHSQSFPHSEPFYEGPVNEGYIEEPPSARDLDDMADLYSQEAPPTTPSLPMPNWNTQSPPAPPPPPPRPNSTQKMPYQPPPSAQPQASPTLQAPPPVAAQQAPPVAAQQGGNIEMQRNMWTQGSVLEIFSASSNRWYPALLLKVAKGDGTPDILTMQFWLTTDEAKQKSLYRSDTQQLAVLGAHLGGEFPPGFCIKPSASRPGQSVYLDQTTGTKYQTAELAWQTYFKRLLERPSAGMETVCQLPGAQSMAVTSQQHHQAPTNGYAHMNPPVPPVQQERANVVAAGLVTEYEVDTSSPKEAPQTGQLQQRQQHQMQQQHQTQYQQRSPEGPRMVPPQTASSGATISRVPLPTSGQLGANAETRHGAQLAAELNRLHPAKSNAPEGPQVDYRRAIRA